MPSECTGTRVTLLLQTETRSEDSPQAGGHLLTVSPPPKSVKYAYDSKTLNYYRDGIPGTFLEAAFCFKMFSLLKAVRRLD